jgi:UDP-glucose 4-epimerase
MRALVTGGAGFIGSHLADELLAQGSRVTVLDNLTTGSRSNVAHLESHPGFTFIHGDICEADVLRKAAADCGVIYHLAAIVGVRNVLENPLRVLDDNVFGTKAVLETARTTGARVFVASTSEIYGKNEDVPFHEDSDRVLGPTQVARWSYAVSKAADELLAYGYLKEHGVPTVVGRFFNTIGRRQVGHYGMVVPTLLRQALAGEPLTVYGSGEQTRTFCDVRDVVAAMILLMDTEDAVGQPFNIGSTRELTISELAELVLRLTGSPAGDGRIKRVEYDDAYEDGYDEFPRRVPDITRIRELTGWEPTRGLEDTLRWICEWLRAEKDRAA